MPVKDPEAYRAYMSSYMLKRYRQRKAALIKFLGGKCYQCHSIEGLELDHVQRRFKRLSMSKILSSAPVWLVYQEIMSCQILCGGCHGAKTKSESTNGHGGGLTGVHNCRCDLCRPLKNKYGREWKARRAIIGTNGSVPQLADGTGS